MSAPPPPPPHGGGGTKASGLPPGNYDIFIIPPHSAGSGFLYLPSLQPNTNSFAAGFASALLLVALYSMLAPAFQVWWQNVRGSGGMGMMLLIVAIGVGAWALGRTQAPNDGSPGSGGGAGATGGSVPHGSTPQGGPPPQAQPQPGPPPHQHQQNGYPPGGAAPNPGSYQHAPGGNSQHQAPPSPQPPPQHESTPQPEKPKTSWQRPPPPPNTGDTNSANAAKSSWEKAREEAKKKEDERKAAEAARLRKEETDRRIKELREKEARERENREKREKEAREKREKDLREKREKEKREKDEREKKAREAEAKSKASSYTPLAAGAVGVEQRVKSSYAYSSTGEKTNPWPNGRPVTPTARSNPPSPTKPPAPTARTYAGTEDGFSFRPYDKPSRPAHKKSASSVYSESSYAASQSTARTTPPASHRGPYSTKDPDKIVIKAVYAFTNAFLKTPTSQLVSGAGSVTDGLILRITTEGLFVDDDVRGVPQREWDVKAWTISLFSVWCPSFVLASESASPSARPSNPVRRLWNAEKAKAATNEEVDSLLLDLLVTCKEKCRPGFNFPDSSSSTGTSSTLDDSFVSSPLRPRDANSRNTTSTNKFRSRQTGENKAAGLHVLRATIRDQEGKRYVFILTEEESWKVAVGLQRLRKGSQVRALGVSGMSAADARTTLENLGWT